MSHKRISYEHREFRSQEDYLSDRGLANIAAKLGKEWESILVMLGLTVVDIDQIKLNTQNDTVMQITKGLVLWRNRNMYDDEKKLQSIYEALSACNRSDLVQNLQEKFPIKASKDDEISETCPKHSTLLIQCFCKYCNVPVCKSCIDEQHKTHDVVPVCKMADERTKELKTIVDRAKRETSSYMAITRRRLNTIQRKNNANIDVAVTLVESRGNELIDEIDTIRDIRIHELEDYRSNINTQFVEIENQLDQTSDSLNKAEQIWKEICTTESHTKRILLAEKLYKLVQHINQDRASFPPIEKPEFICSDANVEEAMLNVFGRCNFYRNRRSDSIKCEKLSDPVISVIETKLESSLTFQYAENDVIRNIIPDTNGNVWVTLKRSRNISLLNKSGKEIKTTPVDFRINSIERLSYDELLITTYSGTSKYPHDILKLKSNGDISSFLSVEKLIPCSLAVSNKGFIYVGMVDTYSFYVSTASIRTIKKFTLSGLYKRDYQFDEKGDFLFIQPYTILEHANGDLWVKNRFALVEGNVIVLSETGKLKFQYCGASTLRTKETFYPGDLCCLMDGNIVISDTNNHVLHLVDPSGHLLQLLNSQNVGGLQTPTAVRLDSEGNMWVGTLNGNIHVLKQLQ